MLHLLRSLLVPLGLALGLLTACHVPLPAQDGTCDWQQKPELHPGIRFVRLTVERPRKMVIHGVRVDTWTPGLRLHTTGRRSEWVEGQTETDRQTTRDFLRTQRQRGVPLVLAINADAFSPWPAPYAESTPTDLAGLAVSDGTLVSRGNGSPSLLQRNGKPLQIAPTARNFDTSDLQLAVSGFALCLDDGVPLPSDDALHPRTGLGLSADARFLIFVAIDGRQPASFGATTQELGQWLKHFGARRGINLDGGGSTTLAWWNPASPMADRCQLLNQPVGNGIKGELLPAALFTSTERANGNNLGVSLAVPATTFDPRLYLLTSEHWIAERHGLTRIFNRAQPLAEPILWPDDPRSESDCAWGNVIREPDGRFRLWYCTMNMGHQGAGPHEIASAGVWGRGDDFTFRPRSEADRPDVESMVGKYAESHDGIHWRKPQLGLIEYRGSKANNVLLTGRRAAEQTRGALTNFDGYTVLRDDREPNPARRYKLVAHWESVHFWDNHPVSGSLGRPAAFIERCAAARGPYLTSSPDGLRWDQPLERIESLPTGGGDRLLVVPDPRHNRWMAYVRAGGWEYPALSYSADLLRWSPAEPARQITPADVQAPAVECLIPFNYGNQDLAFPCGMDKPRGAFTVMLASRQEGEEWEWVERREPFIPAGPPGSYYATGAVPLHNEPLIVGDQLLIYFNAFSRQPGSPCPFGQRSIGVARLRRDGFAGWQPSDGAAGGMLTTKRLRVSGRQLQLNVELRGGPGSVTVALLDEQGHELPGFGFADAVPITSDAVRAPVAWQEPRSLDSLAGREVQIALRLEGKAIVYALAWSDG
ncbi:MAG: phosphodiester glycosidase family protein [Pirellulales bacterium]